MCGGGVVCCPVMLALIVAAFVVTASLQGRLRCVLCSEALIKLSRASTFV